MLIYTVPFVLNSKRYCSHSDNKANTFTKVMNLVVNMVPITDVDQYYFGNLKLLVLKNEYADANHNASHLNISAQNFQRLIYNLVDECFSITTSSLKILIIMFSDRESR